MNCKPGELARLIDHPATRNQRAVDRIVRVTEIKPDPDCAMWWLETPFECGCGCRGTIRAIADVLLKPIRDPGEDAQDETLSWKPVPLPEIVPSMLSSEAA